MGSGEGSVGKVYRWDRAGDNAGLRKGLPQQRLTAVTALINLTPSAFGLKIVGTTICGDGVPRNRLRADDSCRTLRAVGEFLVESKALPHGRAFLLVCNLTRASLER